MNAQRHASLWLIYNAPSSHRDIWELRMPYVFGYLKFHVGSVTSFLIRWWVECFFLIRSEEFKPKHGTPGDCNQVVHEAWVKNPRQMVITLKFLRHLEGEH